MSDINQNIVVTPIDLSVTVDTNQLSFTPNGISLNMYPGGNPPSTTATILNANISNVHISGGTNGYVLQTDGTGNLTWTAQTGGSGGNGTPGGSNSQVQFNNAGNFGGTAGFTFNSVTGNLNVPGNIVANGIVGNVSNANYSTYSGIASSANLVAGANVLGTVGNATYADISGVAYSVAGANVSGQVAYANTANNVAGGNVSGYVNYAAVANSVAGANVSGTVANATHANVSDSANSVAGANVSGSVANATYANTAGYTYSATVAGTANSLANPSGGSTPISWNYIPIGEYSNAGSTYGIAIGYNSVSTGNGISIGRNAGRGDTAADNVIIINASGANLPWQGTTGTLFVNPVRSAISLSSNTQVLFYDTNTKEVVSAPFNEYSNSLTTANYANFAGTVITSNQPNITGVGTLGNLIVSNNANVGNLNVTTQSILGNIPYIKTPIVNVTGTSGTYNYDILNGNIKNVGALTGNVIVNLRGNSTVTFANTIPINTGTEFTFMAYNNSGNAFCLTNIYVDGSDGNVTVHGYPNIPYVPSTGTFLYYKVTIMKNSTSGAQYEAWVTALPMLGAS